MAQAGTQEDHAIVGGSMDKLAEVGRVLGGRRLEGPMEEEPGVGEHTWRNKLEMVTPQSG